MEKFFCAWDISSFKMTFLNELFSTICFCDFWPDNMVVQQFETKIKNRIKGPVGIKLPFSDTVPSDHARPWSSLPTYHLPARTVVRLLWGVYPLGQASAPPKTTFAVPCDHFRSFYSPVPWICGFFCSALAVIVLKYQLWRSLTDSLTLSTGARWSLSRRSSCFLTVRSHSRISRRLGGIALHVF